MPGGTYVFIDGNYLEICYAQRMRKFFGDDGDLNYDAVRRNIAQNVQRAFYYNSIDYGSRNGETPEVTADRIRGTEARFDQIETVRDLHVRPGAVTAAARRRRGQKKVDILIAVDMLTHAHNRNMDKAILIAGDLDFSPLVAEVVRLGVRVGVHYDDTSIARELLEEADVAESLRLQRYHRWSSPSYRAANPIPEEVEVSGVDFRTSRSDRIELGSGTIAEREVALLKLTNGDSFAVVIRDELRRSNTVITDRNPVRLLQYVVLEYPNIAWDARAIQQAASFSVDLRRE